VVIGDVMGHDLVAAAAMSQIRASLRAFAWQGQPPDRAVAQLDDLVDTFASAQLVTLFYGTLDTPGRGGCRALRYANAGHLPPLLRHPDGRVEALDGASSVLVGADPSTVRDLAEVIVEPGALLVCFTDGLIEVPGGSLEDALAGLAESVAGSAPSAEALCARLLEERQPGPRDDIAVLVVGLRDSASGGGPGTVSTSGTA
jgi:serine phosphatase RsbU (regulator of sigma subunit)